MTVSVGVSRPSALAPPPRSLIIMGSLLLLSVTPSVLSDLMLMSMGSPCSRTTAFKNDHGPDRLRPSSPSTLLAWSLSSGSILMVVVGMLIGLSSNRIGSYIVVHSTDKEHTINRHTSMGMCTYILRMSRYTPLRIWRPMTPRCSVGPLS